MRRAVASKVCREYLDVGELNAASSSARLDETASKGQVRGLPTSRRGNALWRDPIFFPHAACAHNGPATASCGRVWMTIPHRNGPRRRCLATHQKLRKRENSIQLRWADWTDRKYVARPLLAARTGHDALGSCCSLVLVRMNWEPRLARHGAVCPCRLSSDCRRFYRALAPLHGGEGRGGAAKASSGGCRPSGVSERTNL